MTKVNRHAWSEDTLNTSRDTLYAIRYTNSLSSTTHRKMVPEGLLKNLGICMYQ